MSNQYHNWRHTTYRVERDPKGSEHEWRLLVVANQGMAVPAVEIECGTVDDCDTEQEALEAAHHIIDQLEDGTYGTY